MKGSIVLVPFPFDDFSSSKVRPALCLTSEIGDFEHIIIAFISSKIPTDLLASDMVIEKSSEALSLGLKVTSVIRLHKLVTIPKSLIKRKLGQLDSKQTTLVKQQMIEMFS